jgi:hypothetical protein
MRTLLWTMSDGEHCVKKSVAATSVAQRHAVISQAKQEQPQMSIRQLCSSLQVNRRWYYARLAQSEEADPDVDLRDAIEQIILEFAGYGYRRVTHALVRAGWSVNHKRVLRIMREESLLCHLKRQFVPTTDSAQPPSSVSGVPQSGERPGSGCPSCGLGCRYNVHSLVEQLCVPGCLTRRLNAQVRRMELVQAHRYPTGFRSLRASFDDSRVKARSHSPFRSRCPVC